MKYLKPEEIVWSKEFVQQNIDRINSNKSYQTYSVDDLRLIFDICGILLYPTIFDLNIHLLPKDLIEYLHKFNYINWKWPSAQSNLQLSFIEDYQDLVHWDLISFYNKNLTDKFIHKFSDKINIGGIINSHRNNLQIITSIGDALQKITIQDLLMLAKKQYEIS